MSLNLFLAFGIRTLLLQLAQRHSKLEQILLHAGSIALGLRTTCVARPAITLSIAAGLDTIRFASLSITGSILFEARSLNAFGFG